MNDGDCFFGWVDDALFSSFTMVSGVNDVDAQFEEFEMEAIQFATPIPAPGACALAFVGMGMVGWVRRRFA